MWLFWIAAAILTAAAGALVAMRAARAARHSAAGADPALDVYRRHLGDLDDLAARGLLGEEEHRAARAEGARRLLSAAERKAADEIPGGRDGRLIALGGVVLAALLALGVYMAVGSPGTPDQPYRARVAAWRTGDPNKLDAAQMTAVLRTLAADRPNDWRVFDYLGRAQLAADQPFDAAQSLQRSMKLAPQEASPASALGMAFLAENDGKTSSQSVQAFRRAQALDPADPPARYYLGRAKMESGDMTGGLADWRTLADTFPAGDPRRATIQAEIDRAAQPAQAAQAGPQPGQLTSPAQAAAAASSVPQASGDQAAFIRAMVEGLAARLKRQPDDPAGWARLVRSYGVLGDREAQSRALAEARTRFAGRPDALATIEAEAKPPAAR